MDLIHKKFTFGCPSFLNLSIVRLGEAELQAPGAIDSEQLSISTSAEIEASLTKFKPDIFGISLSEAFQFGIIVFCLKVGLRESETKTVRIKIHSFN